MEIVRYEAAGGIVFDGDRVLLLRKPAKGEMVLPKGHVESGETHEQAALRETIEETGYTNLKIVADLGVLQSQFPFRDCWYIRDEHYFVIRLNGHEREGRFSHDDAEYDRTTFERVWVAAEAAEAMMSFEPARTFMRRAVAWWQNASDEINGA